MECDKNRRVEDVCDDIGRWLAGFRADGDSVWELQGCLAGLRWLRERYRADKAAVEPHMDRVKDLSRQVRQAVADSRESLTAKYMEALSAVSSWTAIREACREALLEFANAENAQRLDCPRGWIEIKRNQSASIPRLGTPQREQLHGLITQAQCWPDVAYPNAARLLKAVAAGLFTPQQAGTIAELCPSQTICRLVTHDHG
jgi:hypothetical protein